MFSKNEIVGSYRIIRPLGEADERLARARTEKPQREVERAVRMRRAGLG